MNVLKGPVCANWGSSLFFPQHGSGHARVRTENSGAFWENVKSLLQIESRRCFCLILPFTFTTLTYKCRARTALGGIWLQLSVLFIIYFPMLMEKWISASSKRGGPVCKPAPNKAPTHKKKRVIKSGRWKGTVAVEWLFIHFVTIHS